MWQNNYGFNDGDSPNNIDQNGFPIPPFAQQFNQDPQSEGYPNFRPAIGVSNEPMFMYNQMTASPMAQFPPFPPAQFNTPQTFSPTAMAPTQINARAAELKAQLLKGRARRASNSASAKMGGQVTKQQNGSDRPNPSLQNSPNSVAADFEREHNIDELISEYSESNPTAGAKMKRQGKEMAETPSPSSQPPSTARPLAMPQGHSSASSTKLAKLITNGSTTNIVTNEKTPSPAQTYHYNGSAAEMSEGEIADEEIRDQEIQQHGLPVTKPKDSPVTIPQGNARTRNPPIEQASATKPNNYPNPLLGNTLPYCPPSRTPSRMVRPALSPSVVAWKEEVNSCQEKLAWSDNKNSWGMHPDSDKQSYPCNRSPDHNKELHTPDVTSEHNQRESIQPPLETGVPILAHLLVHDRDLREWLEVTDYFNVPNRDKILKRRRAIAELDEQRRKLVAEIETDERKPVLIAPGPQYSSSAIPPSPYVKNEDVQAETIPIAKHAESRPPHDRVVSNKRSYNDTKESGPVKLQRIDGRPMTTSYESGPPRPRYADSRGRFRSPSPERGRSPEWRPYDRRSPSPRRMRSFDRLDESGYGLGRERPPFEIHGGYRGRTYDPTFRRSRGPIRGHGDGHLGSRTDGTIANGRPFKDPEGFKRGGNGGR